MRRWILGGVAMAVAVAVIILALIGTLNHTSRRDATFNAGSPIATSTTTATTRAHTAAGPATTPASPTVLPRSRWPATPAATRLRAKIDKALKPAGPHVGVLVYDISAHAELAGRNPDVWRAPASVEKLWTTTAVLVKFGPHARLRTSVLGTGRLRGHTWHGNLYLRGGGDPTFGDAAFNRVWNHGSGPIPAQLVERLRRRGIRRVTGKVFADESLFDRRRGGLMTDYKPDVPDFGGRLSALDYDHGTTAPHYGPATLAAHVLAETMRGAGISARAGTRTRRTPPRSDLLASVQSPPMSVLTRLMDVPSDDLFAELLAKQLGVLFGNGGTISAGARVIRQTVASEYGLHPRILDGSGLSRDDRTSPAQIVELLRDLWGTRTGRELTASLPTVGVQGTVRGIATKTAAHGRCVAKTGTLNYVTNLAGYCSTKGGHRVAFGIFVDGPDNGRAFMLEGRILAAIARY